MRCDFHHSVWWWPFHHSDFPFLEFLQFMNNQPFDWADDTICGLPTREWKRSFILNFLNFHWGHSKLSKFALKSCGHLIQFSSVHSLSHVRLFVPHGLQHTRPPCPSPTLGVYSNSCPLSQWCHPTISSSVIPFSSYPQSFSASVSFPMSQFFAAGGQSIGVSASASVLPMNN